MSLGEFNNILLSEKTLNVSNYEENFFKNKINAFKSYFNLVRNTLSRIKNIYPIKTEKAPAIGRDKEATKKYIKKNTNK